MVTVSPGSTWPETTRKTQRGLRGPEPAVRTARHVDVGLEPRVGVRRRDGHVAVPGRVVGLKRAVVDVEVPRHPETAAGRHRARAGGPDLANRLVRARLERAERLGGQLAERAGLVVQRELAHQPVDDCPLPQRRLTGRRQRRLQPHARAFEADFPAAEGVRVDPVGEHPRPLGDRRLVAGGQRHVGLELLDGGAQLRRQVVVRPAFVDGACTAGGGDQKRHCETVRGKP